MIVGVPREIKADENRVALLPVGAEELVARNHRVLVETGDQVGSVGSVEASTTTSAFVAQEIRKPNPLDATPKLGPKSKISGEDRNQGSVGASTNEVLQPVVPGR